MPAWLAALGVALLVAGAVVVVIGVLAIFWPFDEDGRRRRPGL